MPERLCRNDRGAANEILPVLAKTPVCFGHRSAAGKGDRLEQLHQLVYAAKKMRYTLELFVPSPSVIREWLDRLRGCSPCWGASTTLKNRA